MFEAPPLFVLVCISVEGFRGREGTKHEVVTKDSWEKGNLLGFFFFVFQSMSGPGFCGPLT